MIAPTRSTTTPKNKKHVMTLVLRGDRDSLDNIRQDLRIIAVRRNVPLSTVLFEALIDYIAHSDAFLNPCNAPKDHADTSDGPTDSAT